jgi:hypothetical protein
MTVSLLCEDLLVAGLDDWVPFAAIGMYARSRAGTDEVRVVASAALDAIRVLLERGLAEVGTATRDGFRPWDRSIDATLQTVREQWLALPTGQNGPHLGDIGWMANTQAGDELAEQLRDAGIAGAKPAARGR